MISQAHAKVEAVTGVALAIAPLWVTYLNDVSVVLGFVASLCGAVIGMHGVYRLVRRKP